MAFFAHMQKVNHDISVQSYVFHAIENELHE